MDSYNSYTCSSSSSTRNFSSHQQTERKPKLPPPYHSALHSIIRKPLQPKPMMKKPIAPLPPTPPRIYQVDSTNFKQVVQRLTSVPEFQPRRLQDVAPPPLNLSTPTAFSDEIQTLPLQLTPSNKSPFSATFHDLMNGTVLDTKPTELSDNFGTLMSPLGFSLSPASLAWCSFLKVQEPYPLDMEPGTVL